MPHRSATFSRASGPTPVDPVWITDGLVVRRLQVGIAQVRFADVLAVITRADIGGHRGALGIAEFQQPVIPLEAAVVIHQPGVHRGCGTEVRDLLIKPIQHRLKGGDRAFGERARRRQSGENAVAHLNLQRGVHASRDDPRRVHSLLRQPLYDLLAEFAQRHTGPRHSVCLR